MKKISYVLFTIAIIWITYSYPYLMINPGELSSGHSKIKKDCFSCHDPVEGISSAKCISCHKLSDIGRKDIAGNNKINIQFHENLSSQSCTSCHTEHNGSNPVNSLSRFSHELIDVNILNNCSSCHTIPADNRHDKFKIDCKGCHSTKKWNDLVNFRHDFISDMEAANCISCHKAPDDEFHKTVTGSCNTCHSTNKWVPSTFDHSSKFALDEEHNTKCITCHINNNFKKYTCYGCHEHSPGKIADEHNEEGINDFDDCVSCHKNGNEHDVKKEFNRDDHYKKENGKEKDEDDDDDED